MRIFFLALLCSVAVAASAAPLPRRGTLGVSFRAVPEDIRTKLKLGPQEAVQVTADANGLKTGDLVIGVDDQRFKSFGEWNDLVRKFSAGPKITLKVLRDEKEQSIELTFQPRKPDNTETYDSIYDDVLSSGNRIRTIITRPKAPGKYPVFYWIQGINASTIDYPLSANNGMCNVMRPFAESYVTVRVEKTGVGDSEGGPANLVGYNEELEIYKDALKSLSKYDFVDRDQVYLFGHSMGGCHAPLVGAELPVKGIISYGTVSNSWLEWEVRAPRIQGPLGGQSRAEVDKEVRLITAFYHYVFTEKRTVAWVKENRPELRDIANSQSPDGLMMNPRSVTYMQEVNDKNFCEAWAKLGKTKVLALFGENDWISLREDQTQVADAVNAANPGNGTFLTVPKSDHGFYECSSMQDSFDRWGKGAAVFNPGIVKQIQDWIAGLK